MNLKEKRKKAFLEYIYIIYKIEEIFYADRDTILRTPSINNNLSDNIKSLSLFDLIFSSIHKIKKHYISRYSLLINFLEEGIRLNKKYKLGYISEIKDIDNKIYEIKNKLIIMNNIHTVSPYEQFNNDIKEIIILYEEYISSVNELMYSAKINISDYDFDYRKYFKDDFYKNIKKLNILMDLITGSNETLVNIKIYDELNNIVND
jgi:hypothetical protein